MKFQILNKTLNPIIWNSDKSLKPDIRNALLKIAYIFYSQTNLNIPIIDIQFLGSNAWYNYTDDSDIDLHIIIDFKQLNIPKENVDEYIKALYKKFNTEQDIKIKGFNVELYIQDINEVNKASGVFSLLKNQWIKFLTPSFEIDKNKVITQYKLWKDKITSLIQQNNFNKLKQEIKALKDYRDNGLARSGEFSTENLVFKILRQRGYISQLKKSIEKNLNKSLSLP